MITIAGSFEPYKTTWNIAHAVAAHAHSSTEACSRNASPASALLPPEARLFLEFFPLRRRARRTGCAIANENVDPNARRPSLTRTRGSRDQPARASRTPASGRSARHRRFRTAPKGGLLLLPPPDPRILRRTRSRFGRYLFSLIRPSESSFLELRDRLARKMTLTHHTSSCAFSFPEPSIDESDDRLYREPRSRASSKRRFASRIVLAHSSPARRARVRPFAPSPARLDRFAQSKGPSSRSASRRRQALEA